MVCSYIIANTGCTPLRQIIGLWAVTGAHLNPCSLVEKSISWHVNFHSSNLYYLWHRDLLLHHMIISRMFFDGSWGQIFTTKSIKWQGIEKTWAKYNLLSYWGLRITLMIIDTNFNFRAIKTNNSTFYHAVCKCKQIDQTLTPSYFWGANLNSKTKFAICHWTWDLGWIWYFSRIFVEITLVIQ